MTYSTRSGFGNDGSGAVPASCSRRLGAPANPILGPSTVLDAIPARHADGMSPGGHAPVPPTKQSDFNSCNPARYLSRCAFGFAGGAASTTSSTCHKSREAKDCWQECDLPSHCRACFAVRYPVPPCSRLVSAEHDYRTRRERCLVRHLSCLTSGLIGWRKRFRSGWIERVRHFGSSFRTFSVARVFLGYPSLLPCLRTSIAVSYQPESRPSPEMFRAKTDRPE